MEINIHIKTNVIRCELVFLGNQTQNENIEQNGETTTQQDVIDNPYLRPGKIPKNKIPGTTTPGQQSTKREPVES